MSSDIQDPEATQPAERGSRWRPRSLLAWVAAVFVVAVMIAMFATRFGNDPRIVTSPLLDEPVTSMELGYLNEPGTLTFDEFRGQIVVVNFWASWCLPCRAEHGYLTDANDAYRDRGVVFVGIVHQDSPTAATRFLDDLGWGEEYRYVMDVDSRAAVEFGVFGVPETFFIDRDGIISGKIAGPVTPSSLTGTLDTMLEGA